MTESWEDKDISAMTDQVDVLYTKIYETSKSLRLAEAQVEVLRELSYKLIAVTRAAWMLADGTCEEDGVFTVDSSDFEDLSSTLHTLDDLPEIDEHIHGTGPAKAEHILANLPARAEVTRKVLEAAEEWEKDKGYIETVTLVEAVREWRKK